MALAIPKLSEVGWTRTIAAVAIGIVCFFMVLLSTTGAWNASHNAYYTGAIAGIEILAQVALVLILAAPGKWYAPRKLVGAVVFAAIAFVVVENGKMAITASFKDIFKDENGQPLSPSALREKAKIADTTGTALATEAPTDRKAIKTEIAELKVFQTKMAAMSPEGIMEAQSLMIPMCGYTGRVDGIRNVLTEAAMRKCGEQVNNRLLVLQEMDAAPVSSADTKKTEAVELRARADEIDGRIVWLNLLLMALVGITATGVWAFVVWEDFVKRKPEVRVDPDVFADLQAQADELARRKENLADGADRANITKGKKRNRKLSKQLLEDQRTEMAKQEAAVNEEIDKATNEMSPDGDSEYEELLRDNDEPEQPEAPPPVAEPAEPEPVAAAEEAPEPEPEEETADLFEESPEEERADSDLLLTKVAGGDPEADEGFEDEPSAEEEPELPASGGEVDAEDEESRALVEYKDQLPATIDDDLDMPGDERKPQAAE